MADIALQAMARFPNSRGKSFICNVLSSCTAKAPPSAVAEALHRESHRISDSVRVERRWELLRLFACDARLARGGKRVTANGSDLACGSDESVQLP